MIYKIAYMFIYEREKSRYDVTLSCPAIEQGNDNQVNLRRGYEFFYQ
jgi:hypothetical protein